MLNLQYFVYGFWLRVVEAPAHLPLDRRAEWQNQYNKGQTNNDLSATILLHNHIATEKQK